MTTNLSAYNTINLLLHNSVDQKFMLAELFSRIQVLQDQNQGVRRLGY